VKKLMPMGSVIESAKLGSVTPSADSSVRAFSRPKLAYLK